MLKYGGMVNHGAANDESVTEMHTWHGCKSVDKFAAHPDATCIRVVNRIKEAVARRQQTWRHARVEGKCYEGKEIREG